jgi:hypothetical protein
MRHTWRVDAPLHAVAHPFFMHEMLAFSAFHKAHKLPEKRVQYYAFGVHHQDMTIRGVRQKLLNVTPHEAPAIFATSTLLTLSVFASTGFELGHPELASTLSAIDGILNIFHLMLGMGNVLALAQTYLVDSFIAPMFRDSPEAIPSQPMLHELSQQIAKFLPYMESRHDIPEPERQTYLNVLESIKLVLQSAVAPCIDNRELHFLFLWPMHLPQEFLGFLQQRQPGALAIVMYYSTMLFASQTRYWFMQGWGEHLMRACLEGLNEDWRQGVQWPSSFINSRPSWNLFTNLAQSRHGLNIPIHTPNVTAFTYGNRNPAEAATHRQQTKAPPDLPEAKDPGTGAYAQHATTSRSAQNQESNPAMHAERFGPADHA